MNVDHLVSMGPANISQPDVRFTAEALIVARSAFKEAGKDLVEAQQTLPSSQWKDAEAEDKAIAESKPAPKTRSHTLAHEKRISDCEHRQRVAQLAVDRAERSATEALTKHEAEWAEEVTAELELRDEEWKVLLAGLQVAAAKRSAVRRIAGTVLGDVQGVGAVEFSLRQLGGIEVPTGGPRHAAIAVGDILAGLADLGKQAAPAETESGLPPGWTGLEAAGDARGGPPNVAPLGPPEDTRAGSAKVQEFIQRATAAKAANAA